MANPEKAKAKIKSWRESERGKAVRRNYRNKWAKENPEKIIAQRRRRYIKHLQKYKETAKEYRKAHPGYDREKVKRWVEANKERHRKNCREYVARRSAEDLHFRLASRMRSRIRTALKYSGVKKKSRTQELVGCSIAFLKQYLEARFLPGMSWSIGRQIHIDHIRPCSSFDLTDPVQVKQCFHYSNLQPLWARDNIRKSDSMPAPFQAALL